MAATTHPIRYTDTTAATNRRPHLRVIDGGAGSTTGSSTGSSTGSMTGSTIRSTRSSGARTDVSELRLVERRRAVRIALIGVVCWVLLLLAGLAGASRPTAGPTAGPAAGPTAQGTSAREAAIRPESAVAADRSQSPGVQTR